MLAGRKGSHVYSSQKLKETFAAKVVFARNPVSQFCSACGLSTEPDVANLI
jgi:hypothetical protein